MLRATKQQSSVQFQVGIYALVNQTAVVILHMQLLSSETQEEKKITH